MDPILQSQPDWGNARIRLRCDLGSSLRTSNGQNYIQIEDPLRSQFFRLGLAEWELVQQFDGDRTLRQILRSAGRGKDEQEAKQLRDTANRLAQWLLNSGLGERVSGPAPAATNSQADTKWRHGLQQLTKMAAWNPLFMNIPLGNPEPYLRRILPYTSWLFSRPAAAGFCILFVWAMLTVAFQWARFSSGLEQVFASENWLYLLGVWLVLKLIHESAHALACLRMGGNVTRWGLLLILFSPVAWTDVTSAWRLRSRWQRIVISAAGMYAEFIVAALATLVWSRSQDAMTSTLCHNIMISAGVTTLVFNMNCLMRFDGYYILSDLVDLPNLYTTAQVHLRDAFYRYVLGQATPDSMYSGPKRYFLVGYGFAAAVWRLLFCVGIILVAAQLFRGAGLVLAAFSAITWFAVPVLRWLTNLYTPAAQPIRRRVGVLVGGAAVFCVAISLLPWPARTGAYGVVRYAPLRTLRADSPGFVETIHVVAGETVQAGQLLVTLKNPELRRKLADLDLQIQQSDLRLRILQRDDEMAQLIAARKKGATLRQQREQLATRVERLEIRAPFNGQVLIQDLPAMLGSYASPGQSLLAVGALANKEVQLMVPEQLVSDFRQQKNTRVDIHVQGQHLPQREAILSQVHPRGGHQLQYPALAATVGGPLAVHVAPDNTQSETPRLATPHFEATVLVPQEISAKLRAGQLCWVSLGRGHQRVGTRLWELGRNYLRRRAGEAT